MFTQKIGSGDFLYLSIITRTQFIFTNTDQSSNAIKILKTDLSSHFRHFRCYAPNNFPLKLSCIIYL